MTFSKRRVKGKPDIAKRRRRKRSGGKPPGPPGGGTESAAPLATSESSPFNADYLRGLKARDPEIEKHFESYFRRRLRMKLSVRRLQESDKLDIINETLLRVLGAVYEDKIRSPACFGAFVSGVCDHVLSGNRRYFERHSHDVNIEDAGLPDPAESAETRVLRQERRQRVSTVLKGMRWRDRNFLRMKLFEGLSTEEMMARFGATSPGHLRLLLHRSLKAFAKACKKAGLNSH
jgi:RNA polymerase sigma factor (sigma-70 family)